MPTFTAITLDRLLEPGSRNTAPKPPPAPVKVVRPVPSSSEKKSISRPVVSPALYATPEATPLPDSPSSFSPSPYIINHKRRGPRLIKSHSHNTVIGCQPHLDGEKVEVVNGQEVKVAVDVLHDGNLKDEQDPNGYRPKPLGDASSNGGLEKIDGSEKPLTVDTGRDAECEDFFDPQDSMSSVSNTEFDDSNGLDRSWKPSTPQGEFFDAFEEISSEGALSGCQNIQEELQDMRLTMLLEIDKRKQAEEAFENLQNQWQRLSHQLSLVGLKLAAPRTISEERDMLSSIDPVTELCQQVIIARAVAASIGRGCCRAEIELKLESQIELKNFEIARLSDRLQYYEAANREMSQRNQEAVERAREQRLKRKRRQKWLWSSIGLALTIGAASLAWSYFPASKPGHLEGDAEGSHED
ncbi:hypothetical protein IHE45_05G142800 [Dioscorea alata]|uniref:Uncharacterized protein n=3 Tax=Dioscorea alata TaxID=55571 RepID=A0ACB7W569_DIOAL|nr:hypothetical protein IHE45_05G142800 [Dioscorea alata]KAH7682772.1 hypothetical protein IHE45_05G142800 [Dioscorea alata]KAH7682773.1 hypothetical protein IHE45_05G142800 [Dioscorea alata]